MNLTPDQNVRRRVERLLAGEFDFGHLDRLFLFARDRCDGREAIREIGDFVAHHTERTKGVLTRTARRFFTIARIKIQYLNRAFDFSDLPPDFVEFVEATLFVLDAKIIKRDTGLTKKQVSVRFSDISKRFKKHDSGRIYYVGSLLEEDRKILICLTSYIISKPAFSSSRLFDDLIGVMRSNSLIKKEEIEIFKKLYVGIIIYAATCMHECEVILSDGTKSLLRISPDENNNISVNSSALIPYGDKQMGIMFPIFSTDIPIFENCSEKMRNHSLPWGFPLTVTKTMMLDKL